ncbi:MULTISPECIES: S1 family peptidase [Streptomyces]|uniref:S1 family peptidase n=1 Tax=Streptomyces doudnae TaxID=3075536 RepID=A0ABD5EJ46_9ACTN|nr:MULTISPECIES: S1 family peptidase [unclassified Streptomyces]MDT0433779.1 S1 family peptidase [Streptomyces sp. DSM 41981]MYQ68925.1 trypsin-like serine protease [Streptomyces sp. SID4950]SCE50116.1 streptogrisin D [Streptomyces sp. SolWspMP-5a-2]
MSHKRIPKRKAAMAAGGVVALGAAAILLPQANASQDGGSPATAAPKTLRATDASDLASRLPGLLGDTFAGSYWDSGSKQLVVNVVNGDDTAVARVEQAGGKVREVANSLATLKTGAQTLKADATIPGTAWAVDPRTNKIVVTADSTVTGSAWNRLESTVDGLGAARATLKKSAGTFKTFVSGGDAIFSQTDAGGVRCSLGFNVTAGDGTPAFLTAGHCGVAADQWSDSQTGQPIATVDQATFPGVGDFSLVKYDDAATEAPSEVNVGNGQTVQIVQAEEATVGTQVFRMGSTTGLNDGTVTGLDATVNFQSETDPSGVDTVTGLIQTDVCAEPGDSGGSLFTREGGAIGLTSGGSGDCTQGGETFFQPVTTALAATGATLGAGDQAGGAGDQQGGAEEGGDSIGGDASAGAVDPSQAAGDGQEGAGTETGSGHHSSGRRH